VNDPSELIRHVKVLEAQVERDSDLERRFEELTARLELRIDEALEELEASLGLLEQRVDAGFDKLTASIGELSEAVRTAAHALARLADLNGTKAAETVEQEGARRFAGQPPPRPVKYC
jgi:hypothetical protein